MREDDVGFLLEGDADAQFLPGLDLAATTELVKTRDSAFHDTDLSARLTRLGVNQLLLAGVSTHTCVAATAADAYAHDLDVVFVEDAVASHRPELHAPAIAVLCDEFRFRRRTASQVIAGPAVPLATRVQGAS